MLHVLYSHCRAWISNWCNTYATRMADHCWACIKQASWTTNVFVPIAHTIFWNQSQAPWLIYNETRLCTYCLVYIFPIVCIWSSLMLMIDSCRLCSGIWRVEQTNHITQFIGSAQGFRPHLILVCRHRSMFFSLQRWASIVHWSQPSVPCGQSWADGVSCHMVIDDNLIT